MKNQRWNKYQDYRKEVFLESKNVPLTKRNATIALEILKGRSPSIVGEEYRISKQRIVNITLEMCRAVDKEFCYSFPPHCDKWTLDFLRENKKLFLLELHQLTILLS